MIDDRLDVEAVVFRRKKIVVYMPYYHSSRPVKLNVTIHAKFDVRSITCYRVSCVDFFANNNESRHTVLC